MEYESVIGLEVHAQLLTKAKLFCSCARVFQADPNEQTCPICLGMPGVLPVLNRQAVEFAICTGLAMHMCATSSSTHQASSVPHSCIASIVAHTKERAMARLGITPEDAADLLAARQ
jgi:Asp-tRNA(Asn)/Glu-tRNA(Gln) amidotransferase B subunit